MSRAAAIQEAQIPLCGIAALIGGHGILGCRVAVGKIALVKVGVVEERGQHAVLSVIETHIRVDVNTHSGKSADDLGRALRGIHAAPLDAEWVVKGVGAKAVHNNVKALPQLSLNPLAVHWIVLIGRDRLHQHGDHIQAKAVRQVLMGQNCLQQLVPRPQGIFRNGVVAHIQGNQCEDGAVDSPTAAVVIEDGNKVVHLVALGVNKGFTVVVLGQLGTVDAAGRQGHNLAVNVGHGHVGGGIQPLDALCNGEAIVQIVPLVLVEAQVHPFPVLPRACRRPAVPRGDLLHQRLHIGLVGVLHLLLRNRYGNSIGIGGAVLRRDLIDYRLAEILRFTGGRCDRGKIRDADGWSKSSAGTSGKFHRDRTIHLVDHACRRAIGEGQYLSASCHRRAGDGHRIGTHIAVFSGNGVGVFALLQRGRCGKRRELGNGDLRLYSRQIHGVRDGDGNAVAIDHALCVTDPVGGNVVLCGFFRRDGYLVLSTQVKITVGHRQWQRCSLRCGEIKGAAAIKGCAVYGSRRAGMGNGRRDGAQIRTLRQIQRNGMIGFINFRVPRDAVHRNGKGGHHGIRRTGFNADAPCGAQRIVFRAVCLIAGCYLIGKGTLRNRARHQSGD